MENLWSEKDLKFDKKKADLDPVKRAAKIETMVKQRDKMWAACQQIVDQFKSAWGDLERHDLELYNLLFKPDALYGDSPLSVAFSQHWVRQYCYKTDLDFLGGTFFDGKPAMKTLIERAEDSSKWALRFCKAPEKEKIGVEKIIGG